MKQPKWKIALELLQRRAYITNIELMRAARTTCPHDVIRQLRRRGFNIVSRYPNGQKHADYILVEA